MVTYPNSFELIMGTKKDPVFGSVIMVGMGGVAAEVFRDRALALPPLNESLARRMLESLKSWPLLQGYRGKPGANIDRLIEILMRFSYLVADYPEIKELDVNPLLVTPEDVIGLDARVVVDRDLVPRTVRPYAHLAIRPYPEEFVTERKLKDGTPVILRPIKPEDEPMWHELLASCSTQSLWFRFSYLFKQTTHEMATRYCFIDYDREIGHRGRGGRGRPAEADRRGPPGGRREPRSGRVRRDRGRPLARPRPGRAADRLLPGSGQDLGREAHRGRNLARKTPACWPPSATAVSRNDDQEEDVVFIRKDV